MRKTLLNHYELSREEYRALETLHSKEFDAVGDDYLFYKALIRLIDDMDDEIGRLEGQCDECDHC
jgi:hypothetical protein